MLATGKLAEMMLDPDFDGITIGGQQIERDQLTEYAEWDAKAARYKRESDQLKKRISDLNHDDRSRKLTLTNLHRIAKENLREAEEQCLAQCMLLGITIHLELSKPSLDDKLDALFARRQ